MSRTNEEREWYCLRRYTLTLASVGKLDLPVQIEKSEAPDFVFRSPRDLVFGLEVTEATNEADQREMTMAVKAGVNCYAHGDFGGRGKGGFVGSEPEDFWLADVDLAIEKKLRLSYSTSMMRLLLYSNSNGGSHIDADEAAQLLMKHREARTAWKRFDQISLIKGNGLIFDVTGECAVFPIYS